MAEFGRFQVWPVKICLTYKNKMMAGHNKMGRLTHFTYALIAFFLIQGCSSDQKVDQAAVKEEMAAREIKRATRLEILEKGKEMGEDIASRAQGELQENLLSAISEGGIGHALQFCQTNAIAIVGEVEEASGAEILRVSQKFRNPDDQPDSLENLILEAYSYSLENGETVSASAHDEDDKYILFTKPIMLGSELCLNCHGQVGSDIGEEDYDLIIGLYPDDNAIDYRLGELRGMWSIKIPKKTIIEAL